MAGLCQAYRATAMAAIAISIDGPRLVPSAPLHGASVNGVPSGS
jgi:hypothetical protein